MNTLEQEAKSVNQQITVRIEQLDEWIKKNRLLISQTNRVKITLNISGDSVIGEVTAFPEN